MRALRRGALPPTTDYWPRVVRLHDLLSAYAVHQEADPGFGEERSRVPGVHRTYWNTPGKEGEGVMPWDNMPYWRGLRMPGARLGLIDIVDSTFAGGPVLGALNPDGAAGGNEHETLRVTSRRLVYVASRIGGALRTQDRLIDPGSPDEISAGGALIDYAKGQVAGYEPPTLGDYEQLAAILKQGIAAGHGRMG